MLLQNADAIIARPYRDRQVIVLSHDDATRDDQPAEAKLSDYFRHNALTGPPPSVWLKRDYWADSRNYGIFGYAFDRLRGRTGSGNGGSGDGGRLVRVDGADIERIVDFPPGHPRYDVAYVGHPLRPNKYVPMASFHRAMFIDKFFELTHILTALGAREISVNYSSDRSDKKGGSVGFSVAEELVGKLETSAETRNVRKSSGELKATFEPEGEPALPDDLAWYPHETAWRSVARSRLDGGLNTIEVALRYEDDFGINGKVAAGLKGCGIELGGHFEEFERTVWRFSGTFA
ncbi:hypothetical protein B7H23_07370 [Notoacmeibacter marinus]|uniref:Uncharacterized protein n=1 Tax=Notoacmeibacter marinus TaxID=1876515 RepID=A0A231V526_9HYPH|nr:hypothetical protein [Notoacmeibacter marinus]OXT02696.1 hypothetical protein B7H23_07370 [Notoacmeibacter marinus]